MNRILRYFFPAVLVLAAGCETTDDYMLENLDGEDSVEAAPQHELDIRRVTLTDEGRTLNVGLNLVADLNGVQLEDRDSVTVTAVESLSDGKPFTSSSQPVFVRVERTGASELESHKVILDVIIDLTLSQEAVAAQQSAVRGIRTLFGPERLVLSFMGAEGVTESVQATDYVIANRFKSTGGNKKLLSSVLSELKESPVEGDSTVRLVAVFSDGRLYNRNAPIDPRHFDIQEELFSFCSGEGSGTSLLYVNFPSGDSENEAGNLMTSLCESTAGLYQASFDASAFNNFIFDKFGIEHVDYNFVFRNPSNRIYNGRRHFIKVECVSGGETVATGEGIYSAGSFYRPVVVNGNSTLMVILQGIVLALAVAVLVYLLLQLLVPRISQIVFERKYVADFKHENMVVGGVLVGSECYYCKAPFVEGDRIVAKCKHVMHKSCWDENGYHCPEYSRNCKDGSHYYNPHRLLDPGNAMYQMKWILGAVFAGLFSWIVFSVVNSDYSIRIMEKLMFSIQKITPGSAEALHFRTDHITELNQLPSFGLYIGFALTCVLSAFSVHRKGWLMTVADVLVRGIAGAVCGYLLFLAGCVVNLILDIDMDFLIDWIPWAATGFVVLFLSTWGTRIKMKKNLVIGALAIGILTMLVWDLIFVSRGTDYRVFLLVSHMVFTVGIALSVAKASPRSERYYFHVGGAMKEMDIAVYKWFEANSSRVVTAGRSVDCDLVMSWDMAGDIAPVQVKFHKKGGHVYMTPVEDGVIIKGRNLPPDKTRCLYHGTRFTIGKTEFIYQENDI